MVKNILVPCDFTPAAIEAYKMAINMATTHQGVVSLLYAVNLPVIYDPLNTGNLPLPIDPGLFSEVKKDIKKLYTQLDQEWGTASVKTKLEITQGNLSESIIKLTGKG